MNYRRDNSLELCAVMMRLPRAPIRASSLGGDGLACLERARRSQPADRRLAHAIAARQIGLYRALGEALDRFLALMGSERLWTSKTHAASFGALPAVICTRSDQFTLELGQAAEHRDHQLAVRRGGIRPGVMKRTEASTGLADRIDDVEQVAGRAREEQFAANQLYISSLGCPRKDPPFHPLFYLFCPIYPKPYLAYSTQQY